MNRAFRSSIVGLWSVGMSLVFTAFGCNAQSYVTVITNQQSAYKIMLPAVPTKSEVRAADLLQQFIREATGARLPVEKESATGGSASLKAVYIGRTRGAERLGLILGNQTEAFRLVMDKDCLYMVGGQGHATEYGVYYFAEHYLDGRKPDQHPAVFNVKRGLQLPSDLDEKITPAFAYRESYYPMSLDGDYLNWHGLQRFEDLWGLWGHSYNKLIPPALYFKAHPAYYALVNGVRQPSQLCLSNPKVLSMVIDTLRIMMADNPDALYWSVSPNDGGGYCSCDDCARIDKQEGGPQGSLIRFVNQVAAAFPDKKITTLAYGGTAGAPFKTRAAENVVVFVSTIDVFRDRPVRVADDPAAVRFRRDLSDWSRMADQIFVWDYSVQFTNYLSPFPDLETLGDNFRYFKQAGVTGIFEQGSGDTYGDAAELSSFVQAKLLWRPELNVDSLIRSFCTDYYGAGAPAVLTYLTARREALTASKRHLDIYGNPVLDARGFLSLQHMEDYERLLQQALDKVSGNLIYEGRIQRLQLSLTYAGLQQARFYGIDPGGFLDAGGKDADPLYYRIRPGWEKKVADFVAGCTAAGVKELSEGGLSPEAYRLEWQGILSRRWPRNLALHGTLQLKYPFAEDYPAKGLATLTDGMTGFNDFSYNWLCFYGVDLDATLDIGKVVGCGKISINFLDDPRHWIFLPSSVSVGVSADGKNYRDLKPITLTEAEPRSADLFEVSIHPVEFTLPKDTQIRFIKVTGLNPRQLPHWRNDAPKKPMIAADEIRVTP